MTGEFVPALAAHNSHLKLRLTHEPLAGRCATPSASPRCCGSSSTTRSRTRRPARTWSSPPRASAPYPAGPEGAGGARVTVRDRGPGVPREAMPRLFEPFFTSDGVQGSGLGLAIAHELAERMHGRLYAESVPGRTVFTLELTG